MKNKTQSKPVSIKIGVVGEHPSNDSESLCQLLRPVANEHVQFTTILKKIRGSQLDNERMFFNSLKSEFLGEDLQYIIFIRDLDGLFSQKSKIKERDEWFFKANKFIENKGIFFLAIYEIEALILADIDGFNAYYGLKTKPVGDPMTKSEPKEMLKKLTSKTQKGEYKESDALAIFKNLNLKNIYKNHKGERSFQAFIDELKAKNLITI